MPVGYILTLRQHNNDALDLNEELTGLVTSHEALQDELETVKADLAGSRARAKKLKEELAATKKELANVFVTQRYNQSISKLQDKGRTGMENFLARTRKA